MKKLFAAALLSTLGLFGLSGTALAHDSRPNVSFGFIITDGPRYHSPHGYYAPRYYHDGWRRHDHWRGSYHRHHHPQGHAYGHRGHDGWRGGDRHGHGRHHH